MSSCTSSHTLWSPIMARHFGCLSTASRRPNELRVSSKALRTGGREFAHRVVGICWQPVHGKPLQIVGLVADDVDGSAWRDRDVLHIQMMRRSDRATRWHFVM